MVIVALGRQYVERQVIAKAGTVDEGRRRRQRQQLTLLTLQMSSMWKQQLTLLTLLRSSLWRQQLTLLTLLMSSMWRQQLTLITGTIAERECDRSEPFQLPSGRAIENYFTSQRSPVRAARLEC